MVTVLTTCMGRLDHLQRSLPTWVRHTPWEVIVVDYCDPDRSGQWADAYERGEGRVRGVRFPPDHAPWYGRPIFNKPLALNFGLSFVETEWALMLDADTVLQPQFGSLWQSPPVGFRAITSTVENRSLIGVLQVRKRSMLAIGGYDPAMRGWGGEDLDVRLRLALCAGLEYELVDPVGLDPIEHDDVLRARHYEEQDIFLTEERNRRRMLENLLACRGESVDQVSEKLARVRDLLIVERK